MKWPEGLDKIRHKKRGLIKNNPLFFTQINYTFISTSTPDGSSSFIKASTVLAEAL